MALQASGIQFAIASNFDARLKNVCQGHKALLGIEVFCSSDLGFAKPHISFFRAVEKRLRISPEELTMVGDDASADHQGATAAGWNSFHLARGENCCAGQIAMLSELDSLLAAP